MRRTLNQPTQTAKLGFTQNLSQALMPRLEAPRSVDIGRVVLVVLLGARGITRKKRKMLRDPRSPVDLKIHIVVLPDKASASDTNAIQSNPQATRTSPRRIDKALRGHPVHDDWQPPAFRSELPRNP